MNGTVLAQSDDRSEPPRGSSPKTYTSMELSNSVLYMLSDFAEVVGGALEADAGSLHTATSNDHCRGG